MKTTLLLAAQLAFLTWTSPLYSATYSIEVPTGFSYIANHLNRGGNTLDEIMPVVPDGSTLTKWDKSTQAFSDADTYFAGIGWMDVFFQPSTTTLTPGEGAVFQNPSVPFTLTFTGTPQAPVLPVIIPASQICMVSRQVPGVGTYENIVGCPPEIGATLIRFDPVTDMQVTHTFGAGGWTPAVPIIDVGESVFIEGPTCVTPPPDSLKN